MADVASTPASEALWLGRRLRLNRLDQPWAKALRLAIAVVGGHDVLAQNRGHRDIQATELSVETDKIWEWIVNAALRGSAFDRVLVPGSQQADLAVDPWIAHPVQVAVNTRPDNIAIRETSIFIVDAKYKLAATPSRDDQYQMFAYSHLVRSQGRDVEAAVLVYPGTGGTGQWLRGRDPFDSAVRLFSLSLPFPQPPDLVSTTSWSAYLSRASELVSSQLRLFVADGVLRP
jgi:5-methylcytosine-specific restriction endonuclease McrBC regulatory subunit McrC